ncbi:MAG: tryptophan synthase subunit alpha [Promethearchaeota archaeon]
MLAECEKHDVALIFLIAPTTNQKRLKQIIDSSCGNVYLVSTLSVSGEKNTIAAITKTMIFRVKSLAKGKIPIAVGFGISQPKHVKEILRYGADGVIVGSAIINRINNGACSDIRQFVLALKESTKNLSSSKNPFSE